MHIFERKLASASNTKDKILTYRQAIEKIREVRKKGFKTVLAKGVFDIVHIGHIEYLRAAKKLGDLLFVGVENDTTVRLNKGKDRPFNPLKDRLEFIAELKSVDFVFGFEGVASHEREMATFVQRYRELNFDILAANSWDPNLELKKEEAKKAGVEVRLINYVKRNSTTRLLKLIGYE